MADTKKKTSNPVPAAEQDEIASKKRRTEVAHHPAVAAGGSSVPRPLSSHTLPLLVLAFNTSVSSVMPNSERAIYTCHRDENLAGCFKGLVDHQLTSCPVLTKDKQPKFFNFLENWDILGYMIFHFKSKGSLADVPNFWHLIESEEEFNKLTVNDVTKFPTSRKRFDSLPIPMDYSLLFAAELMMREKNLHRLAIVDNVESRHIKSIITQSRLVQFINDNMEALGERRYKTIADLPAACNAPQTISSSAQAIEAFTLMYKEGFTGLPVVDDKQQLLAVISMSDIKGMAIDGSLFFRLYKDIWSFLDRLKVDFNRSTALVYCKKTDTLETVIRTLVKHKMHRLPVVASDTDKTVVGIVTLRDVLRCALLP